MASSGDETLGYTEFELWIKLETVIEEQEHEWDEYLKSLPDRFNEEVAYRLRAFVGPLRRSYDSLFHASQTLVEVDPKFPLPLKEALPLLDMLFLRDVLQFNLARDMVNELPHAGDRARQLLDLLIRDIPDATAQRYLARVGRCFTWGYEAETLILCRSVLEQVLAATISNADVFSALNWKANVFPAARRDELKTRDPFRIALGDRLCAAQALGKLTDSEVDLAKQIRDRGDKAVHEAPPSGVDTFGTVKALVRIVRKLTSE